MLASMTLLTKYSNFCCRREGQAERRGDEPAAGARRHEEEGVRPPHKDGGSKAREGTALAPVSLLTL